MQAIPKREAKKIRTRVAAAFRRQARGVEAKAAYAAAVRFYRAGGQPWTRSLA